MMISLARAGPTIRTKRVVEATPSGTPRSTSGIQSCASAAAMRKSHASVRPQPPPTAWPLMAQIVVCSRPSSTVLARSMRPSRTRVTLSGMAERLSQSGWTGTPAATTIPVHRLTESLDSTRPAITTRWSRAFCFRGREEVCHADGGYTAADLARPPWRGARAQQRARDGAVVAGARRAVRAAGPGVLRAARGQAGRVPAGLRPGRQLRQPELSVVPGALPALRVRRPRRRGRGRARSRAGPTALRRSRSLREGGRARRRGLRGERRAPQPDVGRASRGAWLRRSRPGQHPRRQKDGALSQPGARRRDEVRVGAGAEVTPVVA